MWKRVIMVVDGLGGVPVDLEEEYDPVLSR